MKPKTARRWLSRSKWQMARALINSGIGTPRKLWEQCWYCLSLTSILFRRFEPLTDVSLEPVDEIGFVTDSDM